MENIYKGLPTLSFLPLANATFRVVSSQEIIIPREGNYNEIAPSVFDEESGDFNLLAGEVLYLPSITKVLLATNKYPNLKQNQIFSPFSLEFEDDEVIIKGSVLEIMNIDQVQDME